MCVRDCVFDCGFATGRDTQRGEGSGTRQVPELRPPITGSFSSTNSCVVAFSPSKVTSGMEASTVGVVAVERTCLTVAAKASIFKGRAGRLRRCVRSVAGVFSSSISCHCVFAKKEGEVEAFARCELLSLLLQHNFLHAGAYLCHGRQRRAGRPPLRALDAGASCRKAREASNRREASRKAREAQGGAGH